ncbi:alanine:cation symporter family protein, partial [Bacillus cereus]|nr:alanine:cation symporter family protein [Bacillus cereus]
LLVAVFFLCGIKGISTIIEMMVPPMAIVYFGVAIFVDITNFSMLPSIFMEIFNGALGFDQAIAGGIGAAIKFGILRGLLATGAGMGSSPRAAAISDHSHPVKKRIVHCLCDFVDISFVCTRTALIVLCTGFYK